MPNPTHPDVPEEAAIETAKRLAAYGHWGDHPCAEHPCGDCLADAEGLLAEPDWWVTERNPGRGDVRRGAPPIDAIRHQERERMRELATELDERADACERGNGPEATGEASSYSAAAGLLRDRLDAAKGEGE